MKYTCFWFFCEFTGNTRAPCSVLKMTPSAPHGNESSRIIVETFFCCGGDDRCGLDVAFG